MRSIFLTIFLLVIGAVSDAGEYRKFNVKRFAPGAGASSSNKYGFNGAYLNEVLDDLASHALNYPPQFDTSQDRDRAKFDVIFISGLLEAFEKYSDVDPELLFQLGMLNTIGHNLNIDGAENKASQSFQRLLAVSPLHTRGNYMYGVFLAGIGRPHEAIPLLEKALASGISEAAYSTGMAYLSIGQKDKAIENLQLYQQRRPDDKNVPILLEAIRNGTLEVKQSGNETQGLNQTDYGTYAIVNIKGEETTSLFRISQRNSEWIFEQKKSDDAWVAMACQHECRLIPSTEGDIQRFFNANVLAEIVPNCIHNKAFAFCRYSHPSDSRRRGYTFVALTEQQPTPIRLHKIEGVELARKSSPKSGEQIYNGFCLACHEIGVGGAPRVSNPKDWKELRKKSRDSIYQKALTGVSLHFPRGGPNDLSDDEVRLAVDAMLRQVEKNGNR